MEVLGLYSLNDLFMKCLEWSEVTCLYPAKVRDLGEKADTSHWMCSSLLITWIPDPFSVLLCIPRGCRLELSCLVRVRAGQ